MDNQISFGYWLRLKRKALDLTREGLAMRVGCSVATIRKIEAGERRPSIQIIEILADIFEVPLKERINFQKFARGSVEFTIQENRENVPWHVATQKHPTNLPSTPTSIIGRDKELAEIFSYLKNENIRLITLIGPPGIGKTRVGIEAAHAATNLFSDGLFFVALASVYDTSLIPSITLQALGHSEAIKLSVERQLKNNIGDKKILFVLDDCEHIINAVAAFVSDLLSACPQLKIIATSREALRIPGEWIYPISPLETPSAKSSIEFATLSQYPSISLFAERAHAVSAGFTLNANNIQAVASICNQLDGLPLAIELIAARIRLMTPQALLSRLNDQFVLSADGMRAIPVRQKTLKNAIGWSYELLSHEEQKLFSYLSAFCGGFTLECIEAIFSNELPDKPISDLIASLWDKSMVQRAEDQYGETRFQMLVTIKQFASERLRQSNDEKFAKNKHLAYFLELAEKGSQEIRGANQVEWGERLEIEHDNFRAALEWAVTTQQTEAALRLLGSLGWPWEVKAHYSEAFNWYEKIRTLPDTNHYPKDLARLLNHIGRHCWTQNRFREARSILEESRAISLKLGNDGERLLAETLNWLGLLVHFVDNDGITAKSIFEHSLEINQRWDDQNGIALSTFHLGIVESDLNQKDIALNLLEKSLALFHQFADKFFIARVSIFLGYLFLNQGDYNQAYAYFEQHLKIDQELQFWDGIAEAWRNLGYLFLQQNKNEFASQYYEESVTICHEHGLNKPDISYSSGVVALHQKNYKLAHQRFTESLELTCKSEEKENAGPLLFGLAALAGASDQNEQAAKLFGASQEIIKENKQPLSPFEQTAFEYHIEAACEQLGVERFGSFAMKGREMSPEIAFAYATKWLKVLAPLDI